MKESLINLLGVAALALAEKIKEEGARQFTVTDYEAARLERLAQAIVARFERIESMRWSLARRLLFEVGRGRDLECRFGPDGIIDVEFSLIDLPENIGYDGSQVYGQSLQSNQS